MSGEKFVTGGKDLDIRMYDAETNQVQIQTSCRISKNVTFFTVANTGNCLRCLPILKTPLNDQLFHFLKAQPPTLLLVSFK